jgi:oligopeptide/dipeptide ABC transporter ATP-binding protein
VTSATPLLELDGVRRYFNSDAGQVRALDGVSLALNRGETLGLVGESGCGKSTLGRVSLGLEPVDAGRVLLDGSDLAALGHGALRQARRRMQMVFQDPVGSLNPRMRVGDIVGEPIRELEGVSRGAARERGTQLLDRVGLPASYARRYPSELSGGQAQRVAIARSLSVRPALLVADEAVSSLDVSVAAQILNLLAELRKELSIAYLFISHDLAAVEHVSDRVAVMYLGRIVELGGAVDVFRRPQHPYTVALLSATPMPSAEHRRERIILRGDPPSPVDPPRGCRFHTRCPIGPLARPERAICVTEEPPLDRSGPGQRVACHFAGELQPPLPAGRAAAAR